MHAYSLFPLILAEWSGTQIAWSVALALAMLIGTAVGGGLLVIYLPATYFSRARNPWGDRQPVLYWALVIGKNLLGVILIVLGILMLVLPGQGVLTMLIGLMMVSFPGKRKLAAIIISRTSMLPSVNRFRARFGKSPLILNGK